MPDETTSDDAIATEAVPSPPARFQRFGDRLAGRPVDDTLRRDVPGPLATALRMWLLQACDLDDFVAQRAALRLQIDAKTVQGKQWSWAVGLASVPDDELLDVVDAVLAVHPALDITDEFGEPVGKAVPYLKLVNRLGDALEDIGSAFTVDPDNSRRLIERVDPTVDQLVRDAIDDATPRAGQLLRAARQHAYGLHPDPTTAYREAVRAVEEVVCRRVLPKDDAATLGKVVASLQQGGHKWQFVLVARDGSDDIGPLVGMLDRLWTGQVSRHGGGKNSRDQTPEEARAAVHLAATLVQLLSTGALARRGQP